MNTALEELQETSLQADMIAIQEKKILPIYIHVLTTGDTGFLVVIGTIRLSAMMGIYTMIEYEKKHILEKWKEEFFRIRKEPYSLSEESVAYLWLELNKK